MALGTILSKNKSLRHKLILLSIFAVGVILFAVLTLLNHRVIGSDDTIFQTQILPYPNIIDWIQYRYEEWSGRIFSEGLVYLFSPAPFYFWQTFTILMYGLSSAMLFAYYRLFTVNKHRAKDYFMLILGLCLPLLMHPAVLSDGGIWMTGSIVYFWMSALGITAFYPIAHYVVRKKRPHIVTTMGSLVLATIAASSQEQVGALLVGLSIAFFLYETVRRSTRTRLRIPWYILMFLLVVTVSFFISFLAPGNAVRLDLELIRWLPDFNTIPLIDRIHFSYRWFLDAVINHTGFLLVLSWLGIAGLLFAKAKRSIVEYVVALALIAISVFSAAKGYEIIAFWFEFYAVWKPIITHPLVALNVIPWSLVLVITLVSPLLLFRKKPVGILLSVLFGASFAAAAIMVLSPTMYASSWRSMFVPSIPLIFIVYILFDRLLDAYWKQSYLFTLLIVSVSLSHYIYQVDRLTKSV
jgi:hypothetical protein